MVILKHITGKFIYVRSCKNHHELITVILYIEMPACDVVEPKAPCTLAHFLWQTLFTNVDEKILSICFATNVFDYLTGMSVSFVIENLSCEFALVNR